MAEEADQAVAQILTLEQHEQDERDHEAGRAERFDQRPQPGDRARRPPSPTVVTTSGWVDGARRSVRRARGRPASAAIVCSSFWTRSARSDAADVVNLRADVRAIRGQLVAHAGHLAIHAVARQTQEREHQNDRRQDGGEPSDSTLQPLDRRRQDEREQHGQADRHQHGLRPIQDAR